MALADDVAIIALVASSAFFVALSVGLLIRYRQISQKITTSSDLGHDLWQALEQRMKKQDERILDMMARMEVVQARVMSAPALQEPMVPAPTQLSPRVVAPTKQRPRETEETGPISPTQESQYMSQASQESRAVRTQLELDETQLTAIRLLGESAKNTRQLTDALEKSREHTARVMKELFEWGLVRRNDSTKPFVYQLTDEGRRYIAGA